MIHVVTQRTTRELNIRGQDLEQHPHSTGEMNSMDINYVQDGSEHHGHVADAHHKPQEPSTGIPTGAPPVLIPSSQHDAPAGRVHSHQARSTQAGQPGGRRRSRRSGRSQENAQQPAQDENASAEEHTGGMPPQHVSKQPQPSEANKRAWAKIADAILTARRPAMRQSEQDNAQQHPADAPSVHERPDCLRIMNQNCRGLSCNAVALGMLIDEQSPDILFLTETKLTSNHNRCVALTDMLQRYRWAISSATRKQTREYSAGRGYAGVVVAVRDTYSAGGGLTPQEPPQGLAGYVCHVAMRMQTDVPLHLIGVYAPEDMEVRARVCKYLHDQVRMCRDNGHALLIGGDWNAVMQPSDRSTAKMDTADLKLAEFMRTASLSPLHTQAGLTRERTYTQRTTGGGIHSSRIDDVLTLTHLVANLAQAGSNSVLEAVPEGGGNLDHKPLIHDIRHKDWCLRATQASQSSTVEYKPVLITPIAKAHLHAATLSIAARNGVQAAHLRTNTTRVRSEAVERLQGDHTAENIRRMNALRGEDDQGMINSLAEQVKSPILDMSVTMMQVCPSKTHRTGQVYLTRTAKRRHCAASKAHVQLKTLLSSYKEASSCGNLDAFQARVMAVADTQANAVQQHLAKMPFTTASTEKWNDWEAALAEGVTEAGQSFNSMTRDDRVRRDNKSRATFQANLARSPKKGHRAIFNTDTGEQGGPYAIRHPDTGEVQHSRDGVLSALHTHFGALMTPSDGVKTGTYLPDEAPRTLPWEQAKAVDRFKLSTPAVEARASVQLLDRIMDRSLLDERICKLGRSKSAGPDGIPNELLQILPEDMKQAIHDLFVLMWITGKTPDTWKQSDTILLYKKGDCLDAGNYRPIALANTLYKLWTSTVTSVLSDYAEGHHMLSAAQEGFRVNKHTGRQLTNYLHVIEDAALAGSNLYVLYVDFSSAFNMVDHDKLLMIMYDLGFPVDAIEIVKNIYTGATTYIRAAGGTSPAVQVNRGTIQGDTLSPFLFLLFLEPLLRWLHSGGRGYRYGCLTNEENAQYRCSALAYADDLAIPTNSLANLKVQVHKLEEYVRWSGLKANAAKCSVTGALYGDYATGLTPSNNSRTNTKHLKHQLEGKIIIDNEAVPFLPPNEPYRYLGVWFTMTLKWRHQLQAAMQIARVKGQALCTSLASPKQRLAIIQSNIKTAMPYSFPLALFTAGDINRMDAELARIARACCKLPRGTPTAAVMSTDNAGLGVTSLWVEYVQKNTAALTMTLNDDGRLGAVAHGLLDLQNSRAGDMMSDSLNKQGRFYTCLRQLALLKEHGIGLGDKGTQLIIKYNEAWNRLIASSMMMSKDTPMQLKSRIMLPLSELDVHDLHDLMEHNGTHIMDTDMLVNRLGNKVQRRHRLALNRLTLV